MKDPIKENRSEASRSTSPAAVKGRDGTPESVIARHLPEGWFRRQFDESLQFICVLDQEGCLLNANRVALDSRGLRLSEVQGRYLWLLPWWDMAEHAYDAMAIGAAGRT